MIGTLFTTRRGGVSAVPYDSLNLGGAVGDDPAAVRVNRSLVAERVGLPIGRLVWMRQVHGTTIRRVGADLPGPDPADPDPATGPVPDRVGPDRVAPDCDGIVTTAAGLALGVLAADCVPILAGDPEAGVIGAAHAGRRGAADGIAGQLVGAMREVGADVAAIRVWLGPAICGRCYEVPADMRDEVERVLPGSACTTERGVPGLDLRAGLRRQLTALGIRRIETDSRCTYTDPDLFSHRRGAPTGRQAGLIWRTP